MQIRLAAASFPIHPLHSIVTRMKTGNETQISNYSEILDFWFGEDLKDVASVSAASKRWFEKNQRFDDEIRTRFGAHPDAAITGRLEDWITEDEGLLALILVLDQFPRNIYRNTPNSFAYDEAALRYALEALERNLHQRLHPLQAVFLYLPLEHSENLLMQQRCVRGLQTLESQRGGMWREKIGGFLRYAIAHCEVIEQFGRFPHRNKILGRDSTPAEKEFLASGKGAF